MNSKELEKLLKKHGCRFKTHRGGSGHVTVTRGTRRTIMPRHGSSKEIPKGTLHAILKQLDIKLKK